MQRLLGTLIAVAAVGLTACQVDNKATNEKLDKILTEIAAIKAGGGAAGARPQARPQPKRPDPKDVFSVNVEGAPADGKKDAKVTIVKAFEFACPYCERARPTMDTLMKDYGDDVRVVYKHYVVHPQSATIPAEAACAAHKQGKFKAMYDGIWEKGFKAGRNLSKDNMEKIAKGIGLNMKTFENDMKACAATVKKDQAELSKVGVTGTPAFYINGRFLSGARPVNQFKAIVDQELKKANDRISKGEATKKDYYAKFVENWDKAKKVFTR